MLNTNVLMKSKDRYLQAFLWGIAVAATFFIPYIVTDNGYFLFYGDFNVQQVPFYKMCHDAILNGEIGWNWNTDLGVNFIGSYTFYLLGSPFFLITLLFPSAAVPYLMGPLLILKFGTASLTAYCYIRRFVRNSESAVLGALLYAFSGFSVYNTFFNHFHEAIILFPLLLLSIEMHIADKRRGVFAFTVFACAYCNYFFFYGMVVFAVIYWAVRVGGGSLKQRAKEFLLFLFEAVLGVLMAAVLLCPTVLCVLQNDRLSSVNLGYDSWLYGRVQIYANILEVLFFPPDIPARPVYFPEADVKWSSLGAWLPLFGITGVLAFVKSKPKNWASRILKICLFMSLVPILNSAFYMFNSSYYARWFYMPILIMCLTTVMAIEQQHIQWQPALKAVSTITVLATLIIGLWPEGQYEDGTVTHFGIYTYEENSYTYIARFWISCAIALVSLAAVWFIVKKYRNHQRKFVRSATALVAIISVIYSAVFIGCGKAHSYDTKNEIIPNLIEGELTLDGDPDTFRIDCYECMDNTSMFLGYSGINAFHSIVPGSVTEFYEYIGEERSVASRPSTDTAAIRPLLSVKYLLARVDGDSFTTSDGETLMTGYKYVKKENGFYVYENLNYIPYGFTYDSFITAEDCDKLNETDRANMMLKAIRLSGEQVGKYSGILENISDTPYYLSDVQIGEDSAARCSESAYYFERTKSGFNAKINLKQKNLVFFSVPYESGWKAYVNGKETEIEKVNVGFMAVLADGGENEIEFAYTTPGLYIGLAVSAVAFAIFAAYLLVVKKYRKTHPPKYCGEWPEGEELDRYYTDNPPQDELSDTSEESTVEDTEQQETTDNDTAINLDALYEFLKEEEEKDE